MFGAIVDLLLVVIGLYEWVVIISVIVSWLDAAGVINTRSQLVWQIRRVLDALTEPVYRPIRRYVPPIGGLDLTPLVVLLALYFLQRVLVHSFAAAAYG